MPISVDWATKIIYVPQSYLTSLGGGIYELDVNQFRLDLKDLEDDVEGMAFLDTHRHNTEVTLAGTVYARTFEIINGYVVEFENGAYTVVCTGANHNIGDVKVVNSVSLIIGNSAGLISVVSGSGVTEQDKLDIADRVWDETLISHVGAGSTGEKLDYLDNTPAASGWITPEQIADAVWDEAESEHVVVGSFGETIQSLATSAELSIIQTLLLDLLGISGENVKWSGMTSDSNNNLTHAVITQYTDNTLSVVRKAWTLDATYDAQNRLTSYQLVEN